MMVPGGMDGTGERVFFSMEAKMHNDNAIDNIRTYLMMVAGVCAGVLGMNGPQGAVLYIAVYLAISTCLLCAMGFDSTRFTNLSPLHFTLSAIEKYGLSYILLWTLCYALVYIY
uniref:ER membrane protein complex subunit 6 n=1 Tax=Rhizochromulina marina TaxID=1034831 RepID=A0A7S2WKV8_9STRA|mmetsp:Transcript_27618/g.80673  ORF Transcript_27618/g.80673 Transcript_27618/m.80673 type:complete len:114 (+) Transcript_27618:43-384(+)